MIHWLAEHWFGAFAVPVAVYVILARVIAAFPDRRTQVAAAGGLLAGLGATVAIATAYGEFQGDITAAGAVGAAWGLLVGFGLYVDHDA